MAKRATMVKYVLDIDSRLLHNVEKFATTHGQTVKEWLTEAVIVGLENEIDAGESLADMADDEDILDIALIRERQGEHGRPFRDYLAERKARNLSLS